MKEIKNDLLKFIVEVGGVDNILNMHLTALYRKYRSKYGDEIVVKVQNALSYFEYSEQGKARVKKALAQ